MLIKLELPLFGGTHDNISWRRNQNPLVFGDNYSPKKAYQSILELVCDNFI